MHATLYIIITRFAARGILCEYIICLVITQTLHLFIMETLSFICIRTGEEEQGGLSDKQCEEGSLSLRTQQSTSPQIGHPASGTQVQNNQVSIV